MVIIEKSILVRNRRLYINIWMKQNKGLYWENIVAYDLLSQLGNEENNNY